MNPSTACARLLFAELAGQGVRHVVVCPGSRSAPLALAAVAAERSGLLEVHVRVDERSAAFLALGLAKVTRVPAAVVTTSGTAVANLHPAVLEAHHGQVPLIVVSADRPPELRGTGANQVTDQPGVFGAAVRWAGDLPTPEEAEPTRRAWRTGAARAYAAATGVAGLGTAGPVHVNAPLREPLVDDGAPLHFAPTAPMSLPHREVGLAPALASVPRTVVVVGDLPEPGMAAEAVEWAHRRGYPVIAEPFGEHDRRVVLPHSPLVLAAQWLEGHVPDRVVVIGRPTLTRQVGALLRRSGTRVESVSPGGPWPDPGHVLDAVHPWSVLAADAPDDHPDEAARAWAAAWEDAGRTAREVVDGELDRAGDLSGPVVARTLVAHLPAGARLFVGSSNPVRDLDVAAAPREAALQVVASRGLAGIDGCVSTAAGLALADDRPTYALMGDLTFLHDTNGLVIGPLERRPDLTVVVVNDDGGGIFTTLEYGAPERARDFERVFGTPTGVDLAALCAAHGVAHQRVDSVVELAARVGQAPAGLRVVEVRTDRSAHRAVHAELRAAVDRALGTGAGA